MNRFRSSQPEQITEQDLLALHLHELSPARAAAVRRLLDQDAVLAAESASIAAVLAAVTLNATASNRSPMPLGSAILDRNWRTVRPRLGRYTPISSRWKLPALGAGILTAIAAGIALLAYTHHLAAPDSKGNGQAANLTQTPPLSHNPIFTAAPAGPADLHPTEPGFRANLSTGVYHPSTHSPVHLIGPAYRSQLSPHSLADEPLRQPPLTLLPTPPLTLEPVPSLIAANPILDHSQLLSQPPPSLNSAKPGTRLPGKSRQSHPLDIMLGFGGTFIPDHDSLTANTEPRSLTVTHSILAIGAFHQQFRPALGYRVTLSYTLPDFGYTYSGSSFYQSGSINSRIFEAAGTYVIQGPHHKRLTTSVDAGGAVMAFLPTNNGDPGTSSGLLPTSSASSSTSYGYRVAAILGVNIDYALTKQIGARLGYRAQLFRSPSFRYTGSAIPVTTPLVVDNEPSLGITYTFGKR